MSIKKKIQQSMTVILTVTLVLAYVILSVILYNRNMNLLQTEVKQEAAYIRENEEICCILQARKEKKHKK